MTLTEQVAKRVIKKLLGEEGYRIEIVSIINSTFLQFAIEFFKKIIEAKLASKNITADWYRRAFLNPNLSKDDIAINSGLNMKTIGNMFNSTKKEIVIDASSEHYDTLYESIKDLSDSQEGLELTLTLKFNGVSVDLNVSETLIVINTLAVKRAALRGGFWSTVGKKVEKPLMQTLCELYSVSLDNYKTGMKSESKDEDFVREIDFYLANGNEDFKCEVKLMGKGNPESADAVIARDSKVFVADKLSETNKTQLDSLGVQWVELRAENGFQRFKTVLENLDIPHQEIDFDNLDDNVEAIFGRIFS